MWILTITTLYFLFKLGEGVQGDPSPSTSKSIGSAISMPTETFYIANNSRLEVKCVIKGGEKGIPKLQFVNDEDNIELKNTTRLKIIITKDTVKNETAATFLWDPIFVRDNEIKSVRCRNVDTKNSKTFGIVVIPSMSIPNVSISNGSRVEIESGLTHKIVCHVTCETSSVVKDFSATWKVKSLNSQDELAENVKQLTTKKGSVVTSTLLITNANFKNNKKYYCIARLKIEAFEIVRKYYAEINVKVLEDYGLPTTTKEVIMVTGEDVSFDCGGIGDPIPTLKWWKRNTNNDDEETMLVGDVSNMDSRYSYETSGEKEDESAPNSIFSIKLVSLEDRSKYVCHAQFSDRNMTKIFTLRVRDRYGVLWPILGIVVEAIVLFFIIYYHDVFKRKSEKKKSHRDEKDGDPASEEMPLVADSKEDGAHRRTTNNEVSA